MPTIEHQQTNMTASRAAVLRSAENPDTEQSVLRVGLSKNAPQTGELLGPDPQTGSFDAVFCDFALYSGPNRTAAMRGLWRLVRPGGKLVVTVWGPHHLEPAATWFWDAVRKIRPDLSHGFYRRDRICNLQTLRALLSEAGVTNIHFTAQTSEHTVLSSNSWWAVVLDSGFRRTVEQLDSADSAYVRSASWQTFTTPELRP